MTVGRTERFEIGIDAGAAAFYAASMAFVLFLLDASNLYMAQATAVAFGWSFAGLRSLEPEQARFVLPHFAPKHFEPVVIEELVLTEADRLRAGSDDDALVLDDILAELGPDSRVVRLFDPSKMPTAGQLKARIDSYSNGSSSPAPPDASQALYDALAELKRSLR